MQVPLVSVCNSFVKTCVRILLYARIILDLGKRAENKTVSYVADGKEFS